MRFNFNPILTALPLLLAMESQAASHLMNGEPLPFVVYHDAKSDRNHYRPSGWMGDYGDIRLDENWPQQPAEGRSCLRIEYTAKGSQKHGWAGVYWQEPANNWGNKGEGFNLNGAARLTFWARGERGGEKIAEFKVGGIRGTYSDSAQASIGPITLKRTWQRYAIDLTDKELSSIAGGFAWSANRDDNPEGAIFYLDEIQFE